MRLAARARLAILLTPLALLATGVPALAYPDVPADTDRALAIIDTLQLTVGLDSALVVLDDWIPRARSDQDTRRLAGLLNRQGAILTVWGRVRDAEPVLREAMDVARAVPDTLILCGSVRWLGVAVSAQGRRAEAHVLYEELVELARASGDRRHEGWGFVGLGWEAHGEGRAADSARYYRKAVAAFEEEDDPTALAWSLNGLGTALSGLGDYRGSMACYGQAAELARQIPHPTVESYAVNNLGTLEFYLGDPGVAQANFERSVELQLAIGAQREAITPSLNVAICQTYLGRHADAIAHLEEVLATCRREHYRDLEGSVLNQLARVRAAQHRHHAAAALFRETLAIDSALTFKSRVEAVIGLSSALAALDSSEAAIAVLKSSAASFRDGDEPELWLQVAGETGQQLEVVGRPEEALSYALPVYREAERLGLLEHRAGALITASRCYRALDRPDSALAFLEAAVEEWESYRSSPLDPEWREHRSAESRALYTDLADLMLGPGSPSRDAIEPAFDRLQRFKARTLLERMLGPGKMLDDALRSQVAEPITLASLQERVLEEDEVLLDFFVGSRTSLLFLVSGDACHAVRLPPVPDLEPQIRLYHELISAPAPVDPVADTEMIESVGEAIGELLLGEVLPLLPESGRLVIAPDGVLNLVPFASLPLVDGRGHSFALVERWECVRIPSATILAHQHWQQANGEGPGDIRALAVAATETDRGEPLPGAVREVRHLARRYAGFESRIGPETGSPDSLGLGGYDLLHLATHTAVDDQRPWQSAICFSPSGEADIRAEEIASLELPARLAVLSSCESARGRILSGEGVLGLSSAFMSAGVPVVVATLWPVDDRTTARFMERFYAGLAADRSVSAALQEAQLATRQAPRSSRPFHWAGFVAVGEAGTRVPLDSTHSFPWLPAIGAIMLLGFGLALMRHRRGRR